MSAPRLYHPDLEPGRVRLNAGEARHAAGSRRLRPGDTLTLFDGRGNEADAELIEVTAGQAIAHVGEIRLIPRSATRSLTIAVSPPKQARQDILVEKCTELGVAAIQPMHLERSVATLTARRLERWRRVAIAACKQCGRAWLLDVHPPADLAAVLASAAGFDLALVASPADEAERLSLLLQKQAAARNVLVLVGPEGGLAASELAAIESSGIRPCRLTPTILRVETAAIAAAAVILSQPPVGQ
ncbi:MAG: 16S rRNA (uracil(1498)-N(3))-methyltransferase [Phycisphaerae bacterium]|nr:16S rRNA (uracil(1498)-N(3))-methyltransferase [Phycisphaerae bacterium]